MHTVDDGPPSKPGIRAVACMVNSSAWPEVDKLVLRRSECGSVTLRPPDRSLMCPLGGATIGFNRSRVREVVGAVDELDGGGESLLEPRQQDDSKEEKEDR